MGWLKRVLGLGPKSVSAAGTKAEVAEVVSTTDAAPASFVTDIESVTPTASTPEVEEEVASTQTRVRCGKPRRRRGSKSRKTRATTVSGKK